MSGRAGVHAAQGTAQGGPSSTKTAFIAWQIANVEQNVAGLAQAVGQSSPRPRHGQETQLRRASSLGWLADKVPPAEESHSQCWTHVKYSTVASDTLRPSIVTQRP